MIFGKLENGILKRFRPPIRAEQGDIYTNDSSILLSYGWKEVIATDAPKVEESYYADPRWNETDTQIVREWEIKPIPISEDVTPEELMTELEAML